MVWWVDLPCTEHSRSSAPRQSRFRFVNLDVAGVNWNENSHAAAQADTRTIGDVPGMGKRASSRLFPGGNVM